MQRYTLQVSSELSGQRLDTGLVAAGIGLSRRKVRSAIDAGGVYVNRKRVRVASRVLRRGDDVELVFEPSLKKKLPNMGEALRDEDIIHKGPDFVVINKPSGLPSQATKVQALWHVESCLKKWLESQGDDRKPVLVHRLDRETSGVLILALSAKKARFLEQQFRERRAEKLYHALCLGRPKFKDCEVHEPLATPDSQGNVRISPSGRPASTGFHVVKAKDAMVLMACSPKTGRTHQIRVHLQYLDLPVLGDKRYGGNRHLEFQKAHPDLKLPHHMLHAHQLIIVTDKDRPARCFSAEYPASFRGVWEAEGVISN